MKRFGIILLAVATAMVMALPATAKRPAAAQKYTAQITFTSSDGVSTTCPGAIEVTRTDERNGLVTHFESTGAELRIDAVGLAYDGASMNGCHGAYADPEYFRITFDGDEVAMLWIFDVVTEETTVVLKNGKVRTKEVRTDYRMGGPYDGDDFASWGHSESGGVFTTGGTGTFSFVQYDSSRDPLFEPLASGTRDFTLNITVTPVS